MKNKRVCMKNNMWYTVPVFIWASILTIFGAEGSVFEMPIDFSSRSSSEQSLSPSSSPLSETEHNAILQNLDDQEESLVKQQEQVTKDYRARATSLANQRKTLPKTDQSVQPTSNNGFPKQITQLNNKYYKTQRAIQEKVEAIAQQRRTITQQQRQQTILKGTETSSPLSSSSSEEEAQVTLQSLDEQEKELISQQKKLAQEYGKEFKALSDTQKAALDELDKQDKLSSSEKQTQRDAMIKEHKEQERVLSHIYRVIDQPKIAKQLETIAQQKQAIKTDLTNQQIALQKSEASNRSTIDADENASRQKLVEEQAKLQQKLAAEGSTRYELSRVTAREELARKGMTELQTDALAYMQKEFDKGKANIENDALLKPEQEKLKAEEEKANALKAQLKAKEQRELEEKSKESKKLWSLNRAKQWITNKGFVFSSQSRSDALWNLGFADFENPSEQEINDHLAQLEPLLQEQLEKLDQNSEQMAIQRLQDQLLNLRNAKNILLGLDLEETRIQKELREAEARTKEFDEKKELNAEQIKNLSISDERSLFKKITDFFTSITDWITRKKPTEIIPPEIVQEEKNLAALDKKINDPAVSDQEKKDLWTTFKIKVTELLRNIKEFLTKFKDQFWDDVLRPTQQ